MLRLLARAVVVLAAVLAGLLVVAQAALAHVTVSSQDAAPGGYGKLTFRVPNESDTASTVALRIRIPEEAAMSSLRAQPVPGWEVTMTTAELSEPAEGRDFTTYVSVVEFRAEDGGGIGPGEFQEFALSGGPFPDVESVAYPTVQTYSDGSESAWIEPSVDGEEPEYPAPTLILTGAAGGHSEEAAADTASGAATADVGDGVATTALVLAVAGLVAGLAGLALGWSARRRTVSR